MANSLPEPEPLKIWAVTVELYMCFVCVPASFNIGSSTKRDNKTTFIMSKSLNTL